MYLRFLFLVMETWVQIRNSAKRPDSDPNSRNQDMKQQTSNSYTWGLGRCLESRWGRFPIRRSNYCNRVFTYSEEK